MTKIAHVQPARHPAMVVYFDEKAAQNPYRVRLEEGGRYGTKRQIDRYADLASAMYRLAEYSLANNETRRY